MVDLIPSGARSLLDIGCGEGGFLEEVRSRMPHMQLEGIEPDEAAASLAVRRGLTVSCGTYPEVTPNRKRFDVVCVNDVLEHMVDPWSALESLLQLISPTGRLVVSVPNIRNIGTLASVAVRGEWNYVEAGVLDRTHLRFFTRQSITRDLRAAGFEVVHVRGSWPLRTLKMRLLRLFALPLGLGFFRESRFRQWHIVATPAQ